jgi:hypothetical protein
MEDINMIRTIEFKPSACYERAQLDAAGNELKDSGGATLMTPPTLRGHIVLKVPHARDRALFIKKLNFKFDRDMKVVPNEDLSEILVGMIDIAESLIESSQLERIEDGSKISKEDLFYDPTLQTIIQEVGTALMNGFTPSKN